VKRGGEAEALAGADEPDGAPAAVGPPERQHRRTVGKGEDRGHRIALPADRVAAAYGLLERKRRQLANIRGREIRE
jgi:hypothetical protein